MAIRKTDKGYYVEVFLGNDPLTDKKIRKTKTFVKLKDAKDWERDIIQGYKNGELNLKGSMLLREYLDYWLENVIEGKKAYTTVKRYKILADCIKDGIGHFTLDKLKTPLIDRFYTDLAKKEITLKDGTVKNKYVSGTIIKVHRLLRQSLNKAVGWGMIAKNVADFAEVPKDNDKKIETWSIDTINEFFEYIKDSKVFLPTFIAFHTGMREGEIVALRWEKDINLKEGYLTVNHTMIEKTKIGLELEEPKTESSKDIVTMTTDLIAKLKQVKTEQKKHKLKTGIELEYVCSWEDGRAIRPTYVSKTFTKFARKFSEEKGIKRITFHGLRHSHATILYSAGANSQEISKRLRHSRVSTTDDIYIHVTEEIKKSTALIFDKAIDQVK